MMTRFDAVRKDRSKLGYTRFLDFPARLGTSYRIFSFSIETLLRQDRVEFFTRYGIVNSGLNSQTF